MLSHRDFSFCTWRAKNWFGFWVLKIGKITAIFVGFSKRIEN